jgi:acyl carrier protein
VNNLPVRVSVEPSAALYSWLADIQRRQFDIAQHQYAPLDQIQQWAAIPWRYRLFDSLVVFQNYQVDADARRVGKGIRSTLISAPEATNYALTLAVSVEQHLRIRLLYRPNALALADVQQFASDLCTALSAMTATGSATAGDILGSLPAGSRGKSNEASSIGPTAHRAAYSAPSSEAELEVAAIWQELFGVERVSLDDNFFDLGGHSVLLIQAHARLKARLHSELPIVSLLQYPTVRSLARHLSGGANAERQSTASDAMDRAQRQRQAQLRQRNLAGRQDLP